MSTVRLKRSGSNLSADVLLQGEVLILRARPLFLASLALIGVGLFWASSVSVFEKNFGRLVAVLECGVGAGVIMVAGTLFGPMVHMKVTEAGVMVANPLRTAIIPWNDLTCVRIGFFGMRIQAGKVDFPALAAQSNNWEEFREPANRSVEKLARRLMEVRDDMLVARSDASALGAGPSPAVMRWRSPWPAVAAVSAYTLLVGLYVYLW